MGGGTLEGVVVTVKWDKIYRTSDEVGFMRSLPREQLKMYWKLLGKREFGPEVNRRMVINQTIKRMKEWTGAI